MNKITVRTILKNKLPKQLQDKVFWYGEKVTMKNGVIDIYINNTTSITTFDSYSDKLGLTPISDLSLKSSNGCWSKGEIPVLVSSGSFLWVKNKLAVTQRTADTKYDPLSWTTPAGRCDNTPLNTGLKETIEEIHFISKQTGRLLMPNISKHLVTDKTNVDFYHVDIKFPPELNSQLTRVRTWLNNELLEETKLWFMYSKKSNTLEFRIPLISAINDNITYTNPEFHTDVQLLDFTQLKHIKLVPAVKQLLKELKK